MKSKCQKEFTEGTRDRCRTCLRWLVGFKKVCIARLLELTDAKMKCRSRQQGRDFLKGANSGMSVHSMTEHILTQNSEVIGSDVAATDDARIPGEV